MTFIRLWFLYKKWFASDNCFFLKFSFICHWKESTLIVIVRHRLYHGHTIIIIHIIITKSMIIEIIIIKSTVIMFMIITRSCQPGSYSGGSARLIGGKLKTGGVGRKWLLGVGGQGLLGNDDDDAFDDDDYWHIKEVRSEISIPTQSNPLTAVEH